MYPNSQFERQASQHFFKILPATPNVPMVTNFQFLGQPKPKRVQVKNACVNCQKACKKCDDGRPCQRCIKYNLTNSCISSKRKPRKKGIKRGPYKKRKKGIDNVHLLYHQRQYAGWVYSTLPGNIPVPNTVNDLSQVASQYHIVPNIPSPVEPANFTPDSLQPKYKLANVSGNMTASVQANSGYSYNLSPVSNSVKDEHTPQPTTAATICQSTSEIPFHLPPIGSHNQGVPIPEQTTPYTTLRSTDDRYCTNNHTRNLTSSSSLDLLTDVALSSSYKSTQLSSSPNERTCSIPLPNTQYNAKDQPFQQQLPPPSYSDFDNKLPIYNTQIRRLSQLLCDIHIGQDNDSENKIKKVCISEADKHIDIVSNAPAARSTTANIPRYRNTSSYDVPSIKSDILAPVDRRLSLYAYKL